MESLEKEFESLKLNQKIQELEDVIDEIDFAGTKSDQCSHLPWISLEDSKSQVYLVKFNSTRKLPVFSVYQHNSKSDEKNLGRLNTFKEYPCDNLKGKQLGSKDYTRSGWTRGHLSPQMAFRYSSAARAASNYFINIAPQDMYANTAPWSQLEQKIHAFLKGKTAIIMTGTCEKFSIKTSKKLPIPDCFWKVVCTTSSSGITAAAFYHKNIESTTEHEKSQRSGEVFQVRDVNFVKQLIGNHDWTSLWSEGDKYFAPQHKANLMIQDCKVALDSKGKSFWNSVIN